MHFATEVMGLQTLLAMVFSATLLTTAQSRLVTEKSDDYEESEEYHDYESDVVLCAPNTYFSVEKDNCIPCSSCPINNLVIKPCHRFQDTLCMPFPELTSKQKDNQNNSHSQQRQNIADSETAEWKSLSFVLFIIIALIVLALTTIAAALCLLRRRTYTTTKEIVCEYGPAPKPPVDV